MSAAVVFWGSVVVAVTALAGVIRLSLALRRQERETDAKLAALARLLHSSRARITIVPVSQTAGADELSLLEVHALKKLRERREFDPFERIAPDLERQGESE